MASQRLRKRDRLGSLSESQSAKLAQKLKSAEISQVETQIKPREYKFAMAPLTAAQLRLWYAWKMAPTDPAYNLAGSLYFEGQLSAEKVRICFDYLVQKHAVLNVCFNEQDEVVTQQVRQVTEFEFHYLQANDIDSDQLVADYAKRPFDLFKGSLLRVVLLDNPQGCELLVVMHHIVTDGTSMQQLLNEFVALYMAEKMPDATATNPLDFVDFALWQQQQSKPQLAKQLDDWRAELGDNFAPLALPADSTQRRSKSYDISHHQLTLPNHTWQQITALTSEFNTTPYIVMLTAFQFLLHRYCGQSDIKVGVPVANRHHAETHDLVGFFVNTQVLRLEVKSARSFDDLLTQAVSRNLFAQSNQDLPFEQLVDGIKPERLQGIHPLFQVMFNYLKRDKSSLRQLNDVKLLDTHAHRFTMPFDIQLDVIEQSGASVELNLYWAKQLFTPTFAEQLLADLAYLLGRLSDNRKVSLELYNWLSPQAIATLTQWQQGTAAFSMLKPVHQLISEQAQNSPDAIALCFEDKQMSYGEFERHTNQLAYQLIANGVTCESAVGVHMTRSFEMVLSLIAIVKAGAAYVPLDPSLPQERLQYIIEQSQIGLILTNLAQTMDIEIKSIVVDVEQPSYKEQPTTLPQVDIHPLQAAYVIFTSGSTGKPKGVTNSHQALLNRIEWQHSQYPIAANDKVLQKTPFGFDVSVWEFFWPLMKGATLVVAEPEVHKQPEQLVQLICQQQVTLLHFVPSMLQAFVEEPSISQCSSIKHILSSGEVLPATVVKSVADLLPNAQLHNLYGPTEAAIDVSYFDCDKYSGSTIPIGQPIAGICLYVLDQNLNQVPINAIGELYIGGVGLARGYVGRAELTAERFVANPFADDGSRLYRTGDLVRWNNDGLLQYQGRTDHQVKIRGLRIELGEIEAQLLTINGIDEAVVVADDSGNSTRLVAYVSGQAIDSESIQQALSQQLPDYMVPSVIMVLDKLPLNNSGKIDRKALPKVQAQSEVEYQAAQTETEIQLATIWQQVLAVKKVGVKDNFFALGGDSISGLRVIAQAKNVDLILTIQDLFECKDLATLSACVDAGVAKLVEIERQQPEYTGLSFAQERQWFLWKLEPDSTAYHISGGLKLKGQLNLAALNQAMNYVYQKHQALRSRFVETDEGKVSVMIDDERLLDIESLDVRQLVADEQNAEIEAFKYQLVNVPFDLTQDVLFRVGLVTISNDECELAVVMHHIVSDGWSIKLIIDDFEAAYTACVTEQKLPAGEQVLRYSDYAIWQRDWLQQQEAKQLNYWQEVLGDDHPTLALPTDLNRDANQFSSASSQIQLAQSQKRQLEQYAKRHSTTLFSVLMASFHVLLHRYSGQSDIRVGMPIANRQHVGSQDIVGFFVNTQVIKTEFQVASTLKDIIQLVSQRVRGAQAHQDLPFESLVDSLNLSRQLGQQPLFQVMMNYQRIEREQFSSLPNLIAEDAPLTSEQTQFALVLNVLERYNGELEIDFSYAPECFSAERIELLQAGMIRILTAITREPDVVISEIDLLSVEQRQYIAKLGSGTEVSPFCSALIQPIYDIDSPLFEREAAQYLDVVSHLNLLAASTPDNLAVSCEDESYTFKQLYDKSNRLAYYLKQQGVTTEHKVGVALPRSCELLVSFLAILKAGATYVPLDLSFPADRLKYMIADSNAGHILVMDNTLQAVAGNAVLHQLNQIELTVSPQWQMSEVSAQQGAYIIYTSGSTGRPKGVLVSRGSLAMHARAMGQRYLMSSDDRELIYMSFCFDGAHERWTAATTHGACIVIRPEKNWDLHQTYQQLHQQQVTVAVFPPAFIRELAVYVEEVGNPPPVRVYCFGGDAMPAASFELIQRVLQPKCFINGYGPTETVVTPLTWQALPNSQFKAAYAPIGEVMGDRQAWVLDEQLNLTPVGMVGELYMAGELGLARGYVNRPDLTAANFIANPYSHDGSRMYRTGDLVRWGANGQLEYIGRTDHQVKIRGFRIELGEIEQQLRQLPSVDAAVVVADKTENGSRLVAYVTGRDIDVNSLKQVLAKSLPDYMVPSLFMVLESLPLNSNGKIDRKALPKPEAVSEVEFVAPTGEQEVILAQCWQKVLGVDTVGRFDNFFELGGDSIISLQIVSQVRQAGFVITPKQMFEAQNIAQLAAIMTPLDARHQIAQSVSGQVDLLPIQQGFFEHESDEGNDWLNHWNQAIMLQMPQGLQLAPLEQVLSALLRQHDALRLRYRKNDAGVWQQSYSEYSTNLAANSLWLRQVSLDGITELAEQAQRSLDIVEGPVFRMVHMQVADGSARLLLVAHHLVVDGVSWRIIVSDLVQAYQQAISGAAIELVAKSHSFQCWAEQIGQYSERFVSDELRYWQQQQAPILTLPSFNADGSRKVADTEILKLSIDKDTTKALLQDVTTTYRTQVNDLLLSALSEALYCWLAQDEVLINLEGHGREPWDEFTDLSRTVGWFTAFYPVKLQRHNQLSDTIKNIKEALRAIPNKGLGFGALKYCGTSEQQMVLRQQALGQIDFNYLGQVDRGQLADDNDLDWLPAVESAGQPLSEHSEQLAELVINGQVLAGQLTIDVSFASERLAKSDVEQFIAHFEAAIGDVVAHCQQADASLTPSDVPLAQLTQKQIDDLPIDLTQVSHIYPLSPMQHGMLFHSIYQQGATYINQMRFDTQGLDVERFKAAWQQVIARHDVLRTGFIGELETPLQYVLVNAQLNWTDVDLQQAVDLEQQLDLLAKAQIEQGFDLTHEVGLSRFVAVQTSDNTHHLIWTNHHILTDGWSTSALMGEVLLAYEGKTLPMPSGQYQDYIAYLQTQDQAANQAYWRQQVGKLASPSYLLTQLVTEQDAIAGELDIEMTEAQTADLQQFVKEQRITANTLLQGAWGLLLSRYLDQETVCFGATTSGRPTDLKGSEQMQGMFINTLPVIDTIDSNQNIGDWLRKLQSQSLAAREFEFTPLYDIQRLANKVMELDGQGLFDTLLVFENYPIAEALLQAQPNTTQFEIHQIREETNYPVTLMVSLEAKLQIKAMYRNGITTATIERILNQLLHILLLMIENQPSKIADLSVIVEQEAIKLSRLGCGEVVTQQQHNIITKFRQAAVLSANDIAIGFAQSKLSYQQLEQQSNQLANYLLSQGVGFEDKVGLIFERGIDMVVCMLAVLKAGATYVPIDPNLPMQRASYIVEHSGLKFALTNTQTSLPEAVNLWQFADIDLASLDISQPDVVIQAQQLAYILYTSGSTGRPKGVAISHANLNNFLLSMQTEFNSTTNDKWLALTSLSFDISGLEIFLPLISGAQLLVVDSVVSVNRDLLSDVTHIQATPAGWRSLLAQEVLTRPVVGLCGGEALPPQLAVRLVAQQVELFNMYGPTETTIWSSCHQVIDEDIHLGDAIANTQLYVLDKQLNLCPPHVAGELYIAGEGLARGYLNRPDLTAERFIANPFNQAGGRLYRTGDLVRWNVYHQLEYLGRTDHQVKIRGFRIELNEIATQLYDLIEINEAVVIADDHRLIAYVSGQDIDVTSVQQSLAAVLPDYMVPSIIMVLDKLPLNNSGKIDRKALPKPQAQSTHHYQAPQGELEVILASIWQNVLGHEQVGRHDNFFALGGDSMSSLRVVAQAKAHDIAVKVQDLYQCTDLTDLAKRIDSSDATVVEIARQDEAYNGLSFAQERQWFLWKLEPNSTAYHISGGLTLNGELNFDALQGAMNYVYQKHQALRSRFIEEGEGQVSVVIDEADCIITKLDINAKAELVNTPFDLTQGHLFRVGLMTHQQGCYELCVVMHHIISDGWSINLIIQDFVKAYTAICQGQPQVLDMSENSLRYSDYAKWQKQWLEEGEEQKQLSYWQQVLGDQHPVLSLPTDLDSQSNKMTGANQSLVLAAEQKQQLEQYAKAQGCSLFSVLMAAWHSVLYRYTGQSQIRVGMPIANRQHVGSQDIVGFFVNTQVIQTELSGEVSLNEVVQQISKAVNGAQANQDLPFEKLVDSLNLERQTGEQPLFQVVMNHQRVEQQQLSDLPGLTVADSPLVSSEAQFALVLDTLEDADGRLNVAVKYAKERFSAKRIALLMDSFIQLLEQFVSNGDCALGNADILCKQQLAQVQALSKVEHDGMVVEPVHQLISKVAHQHHLRTALSFEQQTVSYAELEKRTNQLAHYLIAQGVQIEDKVALIFERGIDMLVTMLAVLKAGAAYVPIDPKSPQERIDYIIEQSQLNVIITDQHKVYSSTVITTHIDSINTHHYLATLPMVKVLPQQLAYVIYTSGSTGKPKGVQISHANLVRLLTSTESQFGFDHTDVWTFFHSFAFDFSVWEIFAALVYGSRLVIVPYLTSRDPEQFAQVLVDEQVTVLNQTPSAFEQLMQVQLQGESFCQHSHSLRWVIFGGEALNPSNLAQCFAASSFDNTRFVNMYGITETTVHVTFKEIQASDSTSLVSPIGVGINDLGLMVLDSDLNIVPPGIAGELYVSGAGLARGYLNRPDLTAERFIAHPFAASGGERLYKTGDLVVWDQQGELEYLGRTDHQVKIRGFRIELGEIEAQLLSNKKVNSAIVVVDRAESGDRLVAYVVGHDLVIDELKTWLQQQLPDYMVPAIFMLLEHMPLTHNGKIDRKALPEPEVKSAMVFVAPQGELEQQIAQIWQQMLAIEQVGRHDNFFNIGGDSISALRLVSKINHQLATDLTVKDVFSSHDLVALAKLVEQSMVASNNTIALQPIARSHYMKLSSEQRSLWVTDKLTSADDKASYNMAGAVALTGDLSIELLQQAFDTVIQRHEILRARFVEVESEPVIEIFENIAFTIDVVELTGELSQQLTESAEIRVGFESTLFDLATGPLLRAKVLKLNDNLHHLLVNMHHIISDAWSIANLVNELGLIYGERLYGQQVDLPELAVQYLDYAAWQQQRLASNQANEVTQYWHESLAQMPASSVIPLHYPRPEKATSKGTSIPFNLAIEQSQQLEQYAKAHQCSVFVVWMASYYVALYQQTGQADLVLGTDLAGRDNRLLEPLIGFFIKVLPVRLKLQSQQSFSEICQNLMATMLDVQANQLLTLEQIVNRTDIPRVNGLSPVFQQLFVMQNAPKPSWPVDDIGIEELSSEQVSSKFDSAIFITQEHGKFTGNLLFKTELYNQQKLSEFVESWLSLLQRLIASDRQPIANVVELSKGNSTKLTRDSAKAKFGKITKLKNRV